MHLLIDSLTELKSISLIGCYQLRDFNAILDGRKLTITRKSDLLNNVHLLTLSESYDVSTSNVEYLSIQYDEIDQATPVVEENHINKASEMITAEFAKMTSDPPPHWSIDANQTDERDWKATLKAPEDSSYSTMSFSVAIKFLKMYPYAPPQIVFKSDIFHPNIIRNMTVELEILEYEKWSPSKTTEMVLNAISDLLINPRLSTGKVVNHEAAHLFENDKVKFVREARKSSL